MINITTWNINSANARISLLLEYLEKEKPDFLCLQEIKTVEENFPFMEIKAAGFNAVVAGQKSYNGVAILSKIPLEEVKTELDGFGEQARFATGVAKLGGAAEKVRIISVYVPNGNPPLKDPTSREKLEYKLRWLAGLHKYLKGLDTPFILAGDFNVIIEDSDVYDPRAYRNNALMVPEVRAALADIVDDLGLVNAFKSLAGGESHLYSFWDYTMGAWQRNLGMLIDDVFLSSALSGALKSAVVDKYMRGLEKPSDHAPLKVMLEI